MSLKLFVGKTIDHFLEFWLARNYRSLSFLPNGRKLPLDLKRAGLAPEVIFDIGANVGQTAIYFHRHFPQAEIYAFEPVKANFNKLSANVRTERIHIFHQALGNASGEAVINKHPNNELSTLRPNNGFFTETEIISVNTVKAFCEAQPVKAIDLLKIDVEGYEIAVLEGCGNFLRTNVKMIFSEVGFDRGDPYKTHIADLLELTAREGFVVSSFYNPNRWGGHKMRLRHQDILLINTHLIET